MWDPALLYVVGHQRPDTDSIAAALGYAWFLKETGVEGVTAARAGHPAAQALFVLHRFGLHAPQLLTNVAPTFGHAARPQASVREEAPLADALEPLGSGARVVPVLDDRECAIGVITARTMARALVSSATGIAALARPCREFMEPASSFQSGERISDHRRALLRNDADDFLVSAGSGRLMGVAARARILDPPRARLILVDHNELSQAAHGAHEALIEGVLDHHRLGNAPTSAPIPFIVEPVGSTCTLVAERCRERDLEPPQPLAGAMLSGILSDTLVFRSPTATDRDREAAMWLSNLAGLDVDTYGAELLRAAPGLAGRSAEEVLDGDRKKYEFGDSAVSIAQVEVAGFADLPDCRDSLLEALDEIRMRESLAIVGLLVTDTTAGRSRMLARGEPRILEQLPFPRRGEGEWDLGRIVSRKKELVPALSDVLGEA